MDEPLPGIELSRYAMRVLGAQPRWRDELADPAPFAAEAMREALREPFADDAALQARLRELRNRVLLRVLARDLSGRADLAEVCGTMSELAALALRASLAHLRCEALAVVGMGKLGGGELNVSSDIDLVFVHPGTVEDDARYEAAARRLIRLLSEVTAEGFVFRVDMRLRPYGSAGPLACSVEFLENYLVAQGREWERYAWLKARVLTGDPALGAQIERTVRPFVFRKYLDYGTLAAMRGLHAEVRREVARRDLAEDVKLGPGGIREIEFVVQALQLIRAGRDPALAVRPTLQALEALAARSVLPRGTADSLAKAYEYLRRLEHRLQYLDDAQRHRLPGDAEDRRRIAAMMGVPSWDALAADLQDVRAKVTAAFEDLFAEKQPAAAPWPEDDRAQAFRASQRYAALPAESKRRLDALVPALHRAAHAAPRPAEAFARGLDLVEAIASRAAYLALLAERPEALERVTRIVSASSWAAQFIARHPLLLDELLDDRLLYAAFDLAGFAAEVDAQLRAAEGDTERRMNALREAHQAQVFRLLAQDLAGLLTVERLADHLSAIADLVLERTLAEAWKDLPRKHRQAPPAFAVIAYGKLGGKELGYASDLDLIFLYEDDAEAAGETYARLAQRFIAWLTSRTSAGILFETDLELRPSGASGLLVSSLAAFERYQERDAWVWEHQALTRARFAAGDRSIGERFEAVRERILKKERDPAALAREIAAMREKMHAAHPNRSQLFDLKHDRGGMIDIEFAVQCLVLGHAARFPDLTRNLGNIALLGIAAGHGLLDPSLAERSREAYREYRRRQHALRLEGAQYARVPAIEVSMHIDAVRTLWAAVLGAAAGDQR
ncbi:MAG: bifunctional [glutamate--ammonia ligase]-adenylyl-L-tyrosine phosphorylase/[glutamate--ammonia-ligase] adenylyltransferase [Betaproteobacteria bacterium]|nr:bifunctional [glutamate--ammonia ligase]-adenylyl-L-tyrosine phosphorylase/[glutamate--ammonia-ligase] adenylyltransferase [Betaproteobacteria bacterium]